MIGTGRTQPVPQAVANRSNPVGIVPPRRTKPGKHGAAAGRIAVVAARNVLKPMVKGCFA
jgi:hypothetical protein